MKTSKIIMVSAFCTMLTAAYAQDSGLDTTQNPVRQGDPPVRQSPEQVLDNSLRDMDKISENEIPDNMVNALKGSEYKGKSRTFYRSKDGDEYLVEIKDGNITHTYRFDKQGTPVNDKRNNK